MPVQINEMIIRANIVEPGNKPASNHTPEEAETNKDEVIRECTEIILEILRNMHER
jgi:hypothetical protein